MSYKGGDYEPAPPQAGGRLLQNELAIRQLRTLVRSALAAAALALTLVAGAAYLGIKRADELADTQRDLIRLTGRTETADCNARKALAVALGQAALGDCQEVAHAYKQLEKGVD